MNKTPFTISIEHDDVAITTKTMYGMRYPDGTIQWVSDRGDNQVGSVYFDKVAEGGNIYVDSWNMLMANRAKRANIDFLEYQSKHRMVKRTITSAITAPEEV